MSHKNRVIGVGARDLGAELKAKHERNRKPFSRRPKVTVKLERQGVLDVWWILWVEDGRTNFADSLKEFSVKEARDTYAVVKREAKLVSECDCRSRSRVMTDHRPECRALTTKRVVYDRKETPFKLHSWLCLEIKRHLEAVYDGWMRAVREGGRDEEPHVTVADIEAHLLCGAHDYAHILRALPDAARLDTLGRVINDMVTHSSLRHDGQGCYAPRS